MTQISLEESSLIPATLRIPRCGKWLPEDTHVLRAWLSSLINHVKTNPKPFHSVISEFQDLIEGDAIIFMLFHEMFDEITVPGTSYTDLYRSPQVRDYKQMLQLLNETLTRAPSFSDADVVGLPVAAILDLAMETPTGITAFLNEKVNAQLKKMLDVWSEFLSSSESAYVLNTSHSGWFGKFATAAMAASTAPMQKHWTFESTFICDPSVPRHGFKSWDDFFTRRFRPNFRLIASPEDDSVIVNPCESCPIRIYCNVKQYDRFWIKAQPYSLYHMLAHDPLAEQFIGGTIYQSHLAVTNYHRWHAPVSGTIVKAYVVPGTFYANERFPLSEITAKNMHQMAMSMYLHSRTASNSSSDWTILTGNSDSECGVPDLSQAYITSVATRGMIFIKADNPLIGMMCVLPVGMAEVGTCDITVKEGQHVKKGDELGMFHYGGSTCCLIFRKSVELIWDMHGQEDHLGPESMNIPVNERIARVLTRAKEGKGMRKRKRLLNGGVGVAFNEEGRRAFREEVFYR